mgnify:FL=1
MVMFCTFIGHCHNDPFGISLACSKASWLGLYCMLLHLGFVPYSTCQGIGEADYDVWMMDNCQHCHHWGGVGGWHHTMYILA